MTNNYSRYNSWEIWIDIPPQYSHTNGILSRGKSITTWHLLVCIQHPATNTCEIFFRAIFACLYSVSKNFFTKHAREFKISCKYLFACMLGVYLRFLYHFRYGWRRFFFCRTARLHDKKLISRAKEQVTEVSKVFHGVIQLHTV